MQQYKSRVEKHKGELDFNILGASESQQGEESNHEKNETLDLTSIDPAEFTS